MSVWPANFYSLLLIGHCKVSLEVAHGKYEHLQEQIKPWPRRKVEGIYPNRLNLLLRAILVLPGTRCLIWLTEYKIYFLARLILKPSKASYSLHKLTSGEVLIPCWNTAFPEAEYGHCSIWRVQFWMVQQIQQNHQCCIQQGWGRHQSPDQLGRELKGRMSPLLHTPGCSVELWSLPPWDADSSQKLCLHSSITSVWNWSQQLILESAFGLLIHDLSRLESRVVFVCI